MNRDRQCVSSVLIAKAILILLIFRTKKYIIPCQARTELNLKNSTRIREIIRTKIIFLPVHLVSEK